MQIIFALPRTQCLLNILQYEQMWAQLTFSTNEAPRKAAISPCLCCLWLVADKQPFFQTILREVSATEVKKFLRVIIRCSLDDIRNQINIL